jgi:hypothetical protein
VKKILTIFAVGTGIGLVFGAFASALAAPPSIPGTNEVVRYERDDAVLQSKSIPREQGDALLSALDGGRQVQDWNPSHGVGIVATYRVGKEVICNLPQPPTYSLNIILTNGSVYHIGLGDGFVDLPEGRYGNRYEIKDAAREKVAKVISEFDEDRRQEALKLRKQIVSAPRPLVYIVGTVDDGGMLSGIARMFYGDAGKWRKIYEANRKAIKNPNEIGSGLKLTIPKLQ